MWLESFREHRWIGCLALKVLNSNSLFLKVSKYTFKKRWFCHDWTLTSSLFENDFEFFRSLSKLKKHKGFYSLDIRLSVTNNKNDPQYLSSMNLDTIKKANKNHTKNISWIFLLLLKYQQSLLYTGHQHNSFSSHCWSRVSLNIILAQPNQLTYLTLIYNHNYTIIKF